MEQLQKLVALFVEIRAADVGIMVSELPEQFLERILREFVLVLAVRLVTTHESAEEIDEPVGVDIWRDELEVLLGELFLNLTDDICPKSEVQQTHVVMFVKARDADPLVELEGLAGLNVAHARVHGVLGELAVPPGVALSIHFFRAVIAPEAEVLHRICGVF